MDCDYLIVGAGIAGASLAWHLAPHGRVIILESEDHPGMHATGRSAAFFAETYGGRGVQPLTTASKAFFRAPPADFTQVPLIRERGALHVARPGSEAVEVLMRQFAGTGVHIERLGAAETRARMPLLVPSWSRHSAWDPECCDLDVAALHAAYLSGAKKRGARLLAASPMQSAQRVGNSWTVQTGSAQVTARLLINAAGAWADEVARRAGVSPIGIAPLRRTMLAVEIDRPIDPDWPLTVDADGELYFKAESGHLWITPHDEVPDQPSDAQPDELAIATAIDRFERASVARVKRIVRRWAGLRSFAPDRLPVYGEDPTAQGFFWCAGQGGFGIQTAPAASEMAAAIALGTDVASGVDPARYTPGRFR
jgi:D-arginine dehydrogenase|tara:strand:- start:65407 stop:66507 length:1101 start_codon:yes stop_codon:yes gene_type:complete